MSKKLYAACVPMFAVVAFAVMPAIAQATEPHWYIGGTKINATKKAVTSNGVLTLHEGALEVRCTVADSGKIWNPSNGKAGEDEITAFTNSGCTTNNPECVTPEIVAIPLSLPWKTILLNVTPIRDEIKGIAVELRCGGVKVEEFTGNLTPKLVNNTPSFAEFGEGSGELVGTGTAKPKATVTGDDNIQGSGGAIVEARNP